MKIKDLTNPISVHQRHSKVDKALWIITYILVLPFALLAYVGYFIEWLTNWVGRFRSKTVNFIFKVIYKDEIMQVMKERERGNIDVW